MHFRLTNRLSSVKVQQPHYTLSEFETLSDYLAELKALAMLKGKCRMLNILETDCVRLRWTRFLTLWLKGKQERR